MKKYPQLDIRVVEMKTDVIKSALRTGEIDAGIVAGLSDMDEFDRVPLFYEPFHVYVSRESELFGREVIRTSDCRVHNYGCWTKGIVSATSWCVFVSLKRRRPVRWLTIGKYGDIYAYGRGGKRDYLYSGTGRVAAQ